MLKGHTFGLKTESNRLLILLLTIAACVALAFYVGFIMGEEIVYTHFFYIPVVLAGIWYYKKAIYPALFLSIVHISVTHLSTKVIAIDNFGRCAILIAVAYVIGIISEKRTKREKELKETRDYLENLINYANALIIVWDPELRITRFNRAFERITGYTADEIIGQELSMIFPEASRDESLSKIEHTLSGGFRESVEIPILCKNGDIRLVLWNSANIYAEDGKTVLAIIAQGTDITEHKRAEDELKNYQLMFESAHDAIFFKDLNSHYFIVNAKTLEAFGLSREEVIGKNDYEIIPDREEAKKNIENDQLVFKTHKPTEITKRMTGAGGKDYWFHVVKVPQFDDKGNIIGLVGIARDITKLKKEEERLRFLSSAVEQSTEGITVSDLKGNLLFLNRAFATMHYHDQEELIGKHLSILHTPEQMSSVNAANRVLQKTGEFSGEIWRVRSDGTVFPTLMQNSLLRDEAGNPTGMIATIRDITKRKRAEETLQKITHELGVLLSTVPAMFFWIDKEGNFIRVNKAFAAALHRSPDEVKGKSLFDLYPEDMARKYHNDNLEVMKSGTTKRYIEEPVETPAGVMWVSTDKTPYRDEKGNVIGIIGFSVEITKRKRAEEALRKAHDELERKVEERTAELSKSNVLLRQEITDRKQAEQEIEKRQKYLESVLRDAPDAIVTLDASHHILEWNPGAERLFGYTRDEALGKNIDDLITLPDIRNEAAALTKQVMSGKEVLPLETIRFCKDGTPVNVIVAGSPIRIGDELHGIVIIYTDITERKKAEK